MNRRGDSRYPGRIALIAAALAGALVAVPAPVATAAEPATDEYTLELPGARDSGLAGPGPARGSELPDAVEQAGVAGETPPATASPLDSLGSAISAPAGLALAVLLLAACAAVAVPRLRPPRTG